MTIKITLSPATEERLRTQAQANGKDVDTYVTEAVEAKLSLSQLMLRDIVAPVHAEFRKSGMSESDLALLLEEALTESRAERKPGSDSAT